MSTSKTLFDKKGIKVTDYSEKNVTKIEGKHFRIYIQEEEDYTETSITFMFSSLKHSWEDTLKELENDRSITLMTMKGEE